MASIKFFLDTGTLICLSGLTGSNLQIFKKRMKTSNSELSVTHIQVDEKFTKELKPYKLKIQEALESLMNKGITVRLEATKISVSDLSRGDFSSFSDEETGKVYDELRMEIDNCEKSKGRTKTQLNLDRDATIAISSLGYDVFVTCDRCLCDSWHRVINKHMSLGRNFKIPQIVYVRRTPDSVAKQILALLTTSI